MRKERVTQNRVIQLFVEQLGYAYLGDLEDQDNTNIREEDLRSWLVSQNKYSDSSISRAIFDFTKAANINPSDDLYPINKEVYSKLRYGINVKDDSTDLVQTVWFIDWSNPLNNSFTVAEEVTV